MIVDTALLDTLTEKAKESPRLRMHYDLRDSAEDTSQRMLNAIEPGTVIPIHRHTMTSETVTCLRGRVCEIIYMEQDGELKEVVRCEMSPGGVNALIQVPMGAWHTCRSLESGSVILEFKNTKYDPEMTEELWRGKMTDEDV